MDDKIARELGHVLRYQSPLVRIRSQLLAMTKSFMYVLNILPS